MKHAHVILGLGLFLGLCYTPAWSGGTSDEYAMTGTIRAFNGSHPDFENDQGGQFQLVQGMVKSQLGDDGKPVLNLDPLGVYRVWVHSENHQLSNVVLRLNDGTEEGLHYKYDGLSGYEGEFTVPDEHEGMGILGVWVKAGPNNSDDGPGYGTEFDGEYFEPSYEGEEETITNEEVAGGGGEDNTITVTFYGEQYIEPSWRVSSEDAFNQWFRNTDGVNEVRMHRVRMRNGQPRPGGIYRFQRSVSNGQSFMPPEVGDYEHFTYEVATHFIYTDPAERDYDMRLEFASADDMWVFVNRRLVVDLGGCHEEQHGWVNLDDLASQLGLEPGERYPFHVFFAQRHTATDSKMTLETNFPIVTPPYD